jgi:hypothetical protein
MITVVRPAGTGMVTVAPFERTTRELPSTVTRTARAGPGHGAVSRSLTGLWMSTVAPASRSVSRHG